MAPWPLKRGAGRASRSHSKPHRARGRRLRPPGRLLVGGPSPVRHFDGYVSIGSINGALRQWRQITGVFDLVLEASDDGLYFPDAPGEFLDAFDLAERLPEWGASADDL